VPCTTRRSQPGLAVDLSGAVADPAWAAYERATEARAAWERSATRTAPSGGATRLRSPGRRAAANHAARLTKAILSTQDGYTADGSLSA